MFHSTKEFVSFKKRIRLTKDTLFQVGFIRTQHFFYRKYFSHKIKRLLKPKFERYFPILIPDLTEYS